MIYHFVLLMKSHLDSYPCPLNLNYFWTAKLKDEHAVVYASLAHLPMKEFTNHFSHVPFIPFHEMAYRK
jgi:hypothetical protein